MLWTLASVSPSKGDMAGMILPLWFGVTAATIRACMFGASDIESLQSKYDAVDVEEKDGADDELSCGCEEVAEEG